MALLESTMWGARARRLLSTVDVEPSSVPPSSILIVRALADPARGALLRDADAYFASPRWLHAARRQLDDLHREAARPANGPVLASAPSVFFRDEAELLACLSRDLLLGALSRCWWWQAWLRATSSSGADAVLRAWVQAARHVPAAVAILHRAGLAAAWAASLSARDARALFVAMTEAHELPALAVPTSPAGVAAMIRRAAWPQAASRSRSVARGDDEGEATPATPIGRAHPPWEAFVPPESVPATLGLEQRTLVGIALALWRAPLAARTCAFQEAFHAWRRVEQFAPPMDVPVRTPAPPPAGTAVGLRAAVEKTGVATETVMPPEATRPPNVEPPAPPAVTSSERPPAHPRPGRRDVALSDVSSPDEGGAAAVAWITESPAILGETPRAPAAARLVSEPAATTAPAAMPRPAMVLPTGTEIAPPSPIVPGVALPDSRLDSVRTGLAGVLFLINAVQRLELFDRLDDHFGVTSSLGGWAWLEIVARSLLGRSRRDATPDRIWDVLAGLDGRQSGMASSETIRGPRSYRLPESWPTAGYANSTIGRRRRGQPLGFKPAEDLRRFLDAIVPYLRWRLLKAMALEAHSAPEEDALLASRLLYRRGRLTCTSTHVDLHMGLDQIDIAVRLAGLDANPGWVPALGRVVTFYFEQE